MAKNVAPPDSQRISRDDLEAKFRDLQRGVQTSVRSKKQTIITAAGIGTSLLLLVIFLLGKRSGKKKRTVVEIRRL